MRFLLCVLLWGCTTPLWGHSDTGTWVTHKVQSGEYAGLLFQKYDLVKDIDMALFWKLNQIEDKDILHIDREYKLPVKQYEHQKPSIRQTLGFNDYEHALSIQVWNEKLESKGIKQQTLREGQILWVRYSDIPAIWSETAKSSDGPVFGQLMDTRLLSKTEEGLEIKDSTLKGAVFYLISGHGGPDPGSNITIDKQFICEDEYAYDVTLRLGKLLAQMGGKVFMIVEDTTHGIRNDVYLKSDKTEQVMGGKTIPLNQVARLKQRTDEVNRLYADYKNKYDYHRCIEIHIDSRRKTEQIDVYFYHYPGSVKGQRLCESLHDTFRKKYALYQKGRGYNGEIKKRELYTLVNTNPVGCYIELGNIQHSRDRQRVLKPENRQALAEWLRDGIIADRKKEGKHQ
jgi:N-acetylmuramoyl-L-alanine amidase